MFAIGIFWRLNKVNFSFFVKQILRFISQANWFYVNMVMLGMKPEYCKFDKTKTNLTNILYTMLEMTSSKCGWLHFCGRLFRVFVLVKIESIFLSFYFLTARYDEWVTEDTLHTLAKDSNDKSDHNGTQLKFKKGSYYPAFNISQLNYE